MGINFHSFFSSSSAYDVSIDSDCFAALLHSNYQQPFDTERTENVRRHKFRELVPKSDLKPAWGLTSKKASHGIVPIALDTEPTERSTHRFRDLVDDNEYAMEDLTRHEGYGSGWKRSNRSARATPQIPLDTTRNGDARKHNFRTKAKGAIVRPKWNGGKLRRRTGGPPRIRRR